MMSPNSTKQLGPQHLRQRTKSPTCVSSHSIPILRNKNGQEPLDGSLSSEHLGEFYNQATWRMYDRIQTARREQPLPPSMPSLNNEDGRGALTRLQPKRRSSLGQQQQPQEEQEEDYYEDAIFEMDL